MAGLRVGVPPPTPPSSPNACRRCVPRAATTQSPTCHRLRRPLLRERLLRGGCSGRRMTWTCSPTTTWCVRRRAGTAGSSARSILHRSRCRTKRPSLSCGRQRHPSRRSRWWTAAMRSTYSSPHGHGTRPCGRSRPTGCSARWSVRRKISPCERSARRGRGYARTGWVQRRCLMQRRCLTTYTYCSHVQSQSR